MAYNYFDFSLDRIRLSGQTVSADDLYARSSFNAYGDIAFPRGENLMPGGRDASAPVSLDGLTNDAFFAMMADFTEKARERGADVFFAFPPVNEGAVVYTAEEEAAFLAALTERLSCPVLGTPRDTTYAAGYFYNTNYHPNDAGAVLHTATVIGLLKRALGDGSPTDIAVPDPPAVEEPITGEDGNARFFTVTEIGGNLLLSGTTDEGRAQTALTLPLFVGGRRVAGVLSGCFAGCDRLTEVTVPDGYRTFEAGCFAAPALGTIRIGIRDPGRTGIPNAGLFDGTPEGLRVVIPADRYAAFVSNYSWRVYRRYFVKEGEE